jgi:hypothetical protein
MTVPDRRWELEQRFAVRGVGSEPEQRALELEQQRGVPRGLGAILEGGNVTVEPREMPSGSRETAKSECPAVSGRSARADSNVKAAIHRKTQ